MKHFLTIALTLSLAAQGQFDGGPGAAPIEDGGEAAQPVLGTTGAADDHKSTGSGLWGIGAQLLNGLMGTAPQSARPSTTTPGVARDRVVRSLQIFYPELDPNQWADRVMALRAAPDTQGLNELFAAALNTPRGRKALEDAKADRQMAGIVGVQLAVGLGLIDACFALEGQTREQATTIDQFPVSTDPAQIPDMEPVERPANRLATIPNHKLPAPADLCGIRGQSQEQVVQLGQELGSRLEQTLGGGQAIGQLPGEGLPPGAQDFAQGEDGLNPDGSVPPGEEATQGDPSGAGTGEPGSSGSGSSAGQQQQTPPGGGAGGGAQYQSKTQPLKTAEPQKTQPYVQVQFGEAPADVKLDPEAYAWKGMTPEQQQAVKAQTDSFIDQIVGLRTKAMEAAAQFAQAYANSRGPTPGGRAALQVDNYGPTNFQTRLQQYGGTRGRNGTLAPRSRQSGNTPLDAALAATPTFTPRTFFTGKPSGVGVRAFLPVKRIKP